MGRKTGTPENGSQKRDTEEVDSEMWRCLKTENLITACLGHCSRKSLAQNHDSTRGRLLLVKSTGCRAGVGQFKHLLHTTGVTQPV